MHFKNTIWKYFLCDTSFYVCISVILCGDSTMDIHRLENSQSQTGSSVDYVVEVQKQVPTKVDSAITAVHCLSR